MYVLVYFGVLHDDESVQLAYENRIVPLPDLWWQSDADSNADAYTDTNTNSDAYTDTNTNSDANSYTNSDTDTDSNADACSYSECAEQSGWKRGVYESDQSVVDG